LKPRRRATSCQPNKFWSTVSGSWNVEWFNDRSQGSWNVEWFNDRSQGNVSLVISQKLKVNATTQTTTGKGVEVCVKANIEPTWIEAL